MTTKNSMRAPSVRRAERGEGHVVAICACLGASLLAVSCGDALIDACGRYVGVLADYYERWTDPAGWFERHVTR